MATPESSTDNPGQSDNFAGIGIAGRAHHALHGLVLRKTRLWENIQRFGTWLESDAASLANESRESTISIELDVDGSEAAVKFGSRKRAGLPDSYRDLWDFLNSVGIRRVELDSRLERNQLVDVMVLLHSVRRRLRKRHSGKASRGIAAHLLGHDGLHIACTRTSIRGETLAISYTYCTLAFSRLMRWFERKHRNFHDHRALFHAAPRYAALVGAIAMVPGIVHYGMYGSWGSFMISTSTAMLLAGLVYVFFMVAGSVEYDYEEKDYQLTKAYHKVKDYTERIKADLHRAQVIQRKFLPDLTKPELSRHIDWAVGFVPVEEVGGDYYDVQALDENRTAILFGDVSGHGMAAAFITCILKTTFASWSDSEMTLSEFVGLLNSTLYRLIPVGNFAAVFVAVYDHLAGELSYVNGGHHPQPWWMPAPDNESVAVISDGGTLLLGINENIDIQPAKLILGPGDIVLFVSDGIVENQDVEGKLYGTDRLENFLRNRRGEPVSELVESVLNEWRAFSKETRQSDDATILALQIKNRENQNAKPIGISKLD